nr:PREDICTED: protein S100-A9-like isoform X1 [Equus przewalskii]
MKQSSCKRAEYPSQGRPINAGPAPHSPTLCVALGLECRKMAELSQMERDIETIINVFHQYSVRLGHPDTLNRKEFKQLVQKELANFLKSKKKDEKAINHIMEDLDTNEDKQLSFEEFIILVARLTHASHEKMHEHDQGHGHCHGPGLGESGHGHSHGGHGHSHGGHGHSH